MKKNNVVFYTDGGCKPNPGLFGWGFHGYLYTIEREVKKPKKVNSWFITERGYKNNVTEDTKYIIPEFYIDSVGSSIVSGTNIRAEVLAVINALNYANTDLEDINNILIITDSDYIVKLLNGRLDKLYKSGWINEDRSMVQNFDILKIMHEAVFNIKKKDISISVNWVKGHSGDLGNEIADDLATIGINYSKYKNNIISVNVNKSPNSYWKYNNIKHPLLNFKRLYFNSMAKYNTPGKYYQSDPGADDLIIGKSVSDIGYSVVLFNEPIDCLENIKEYQCKITNENNFIFTMKLDNVYNKDTFKYLDEYNSFSLTPDKRTNNISSITGLPITKEINPTGLSLRAIDNFNTLEDILSKRMTLNKEDLLKTAFKIQAINITDILYDKNDKNKYTLKDEVNSLFKTFKVELDISDTYYKLSKKQNKFISVPLLLGIDLPQRNNLKKIESSIEKLELVTWCASKESLRYCIIITTNDAVGIWSNFYADKIFIQG